MTRRGTFTLYLWYSLGKGTLQHHTYSSFRVPVATSVFDVVYPRRMPAGMFLGPL